MIPPFYRLRLLDVTASTNEDAKKAAAAGEAEGLVVQALRQTAGRGRQGRSWDSPKGNLYASVLLRPRCSPQETGLYSFVAALAVYDCVRAFLPQADIRLKWPNDVLANGKKISGVLLEAAPAENGKIEWLVIGVGINASHHPENGLYPATSLRKEIPLPLPSCAKASEGLETNVHQSLGVGGREGLGEGSAHDGDAQNVLTKLLRAFDGWRLAFLREGFAPVRSAWLAHAQTGPVTARLPHETVEGTFQDLDENGHLILRLPDGTERAIAAGDVFFNLRG
ncbi:MAG: biotin--[acetyl-CoA-carboxylase] ligase [Alphaproteobacteria bacterium]|nr:biotin--[acetyl-CoA-carboxylase] ligase [Alphaproteobacteria bacterium]